MNTIICRPSSHPIGGAARATRWIALALALALFLNSSARSQEETTEPAKDDTTAAATDDNGSSSESNSGSSQESKYPPHGKVLKDAKPTEDPSLITLYRTSTKIFAELKGSHYNRDLIVLISIARGIGEGSLLGGMTWGFGDDWLWQFRKVDDRVQIVRRNVRFSAKEGSPEERAVELAYSDSVLFSLPIVTKGPSGGDIVDLTPVFLSDLPQIGMSLPGFSFSAPKSTVGEVKGFEKNVEIEIQATYASSGRTVLESVPDSRGATVTVHYSISALPKSGYQPRLADDRIGYFLTVIKDYSQKDQLDRFRRYINRWHLKPADPSADLSPPERPIVFWLEKTVPYPYRKPIREGIEEWNRAFEAAGYVNAIEVRQQPDDAEWDPEDINYNTFRWITASAGFAMGPSRVNPTTGEILDADIIFDSDFIASWKREYETFTPESVAALTGGALEVGDYRRQLSRVPEHLHHGYLCRCELHNGMARELAFASTAIAARAAAPAKKMPDKLIMEGLKEVTMHEVGHTLGLRHNFKASAWRPLSDMHDADKTADGGLIASVMDYAPANIAAPGENQGDYFSTTVGPYDVWAIEYGYKRTSGGTDGEKKELDEIAARSTEPELDYATDEDTRGIDSDPLSNRFDLGADPVAYARARAELVADLWPDIVERMTDDGDGYQQARRAFGVLLGQHGRALFFASRFVGGVYVHRDHKGEESRPPYEVVSADKQREALALVEEQLFSDEPFRFPPDLYNHLAASHWRHWGTNYPDRSDYAAHEVIGLWQDRVLSQLLSSVTLERLHDSELKIPADEDAFTSAELIERLTHAVFAEVTQGIESGDYNNRRPAISSLRRNLQRIYLRRLGNLAMGKSSAPADCQTVAFAELDGLRGKIEESLQGDISLDAYTRAHLLESGARIQKIIDASLELTGL